ncbi:hypothetical protein [Rhodococcus zopfii]|uniref:hypothetical protein n=1 Tax=Rhodococcus zopfii TaxID=43772 RepID=UPI000934158D|nr:hypothetical protein [Rhodococcus zopfii]
MKALRVLPALVFALALSGCGSSDTEVPTVATTTSPPAVSTTTITATTESATAEPTAEAHPTYVETYVEPVVAEPVAAAEPYIVDCQMGLGPVITYWSDGTVTGYSEYCQSVHDQVLADEVAANTPVCDGTACRYPSGATMQDPAAPKTPSPWVQGQLDWQECKEAGNTDEYCRLTLN